MANHDKWSSCMNKIQIAKGKKILIRVIVFTLFGIIMLFYVKAFLFFRENYGQHKLIFGATYMTMNNDFYVVLNSEMQRIIEENNGRLITLDPALNQDKQNEQINYLIDQGVDAIFLNPVDWKAVKPGLRAAKKAKIPVIVVDAPVYHSSLVSTTVVSDNYQAGVLCAKDMMKKKESANIVLLTHEDAKSAVDRIQGFLDTIEGHEEYKVVARADTQGQIERSLPKMEKIIAQHLDFDVVMALNDPAAMGALAALDSQNCRDGILVYGVDGSPETKKLIQDHMMTATAAQFPKEMGKKAMQAAYDLLDGKKVSETITIPVKMVNQKNIDQYDVERWQ